MINHPIAPVFDGQSKILILGSFPSVKSRQDMFFYAHPQNRFWKVISGVFDCPQPKTVQQKIDFLLQNRIALWDVIARCEITGSSDSSIKNVVPNDLNVILSVADIKQIFTNGKTAYNCYCKYLESALGCKAVCLPSTSPANAAYSVHRLIQEWKQINIYDINKEKL